jgi:DNA-binding MarR family transcriptional regulator
MVRVTDAGRRAIEAAAPAHVENVQRHFFDLLSSDELDTLAAVFDRLLENLPQADAPSPAAARPTP